MRRGGESGVTKPLISLQDLRQRIYAKAKAERSWRFWGLFVHVCKSETLHEAYTMAKKKNGAPGVDGVTFEAIERRGVGAFLEQIRDELTSGRYVPMPNRRKEIPKDGGRKVRVLGIPTIRDRVVQGALRLILEPIFEADFQDGSYGYRPGRKAHEAIDRVKEAIGEGKTRIIDLDLRAYFDNVRHHILLAKVAARVNDDDVMHLLKQMLKATGSRGVPQGGVISPLLSNIYLNEMDRMLEKAREVTREGERTCVQYARFADDLVALVDAQARHERLLGQVSTRIREELAKLEVEVNDEKSRTVDLERGESFGFLGFDFRVVRRDGGGGVVLTTPQVKKRTDLLARLRKVFEAHRSRPVQPLIPLINAMLSGWVNYFAHGNASRCFSYIRDWVEKKVRRHLARNQKRSGFGWKRWSKSWIYGSLGLFRDYHVDRGPRQKVLPLRYVT
jgi:RNA-directed DNA polymerase